VSETGTGHDVAISVAVFDDPESVLGLQRIAYLSEAALLNDYSIPL
jgi:hypothetical protein